LGYIGIVQYKEHSPEVLSIPPGTLCVYIYIYICIERERERERGASINTQFSPHCSTTPKRIPLLIIEASRSL